MNRTKFLGMFSSIALFAGAIAVAQAAPQTPLAPDKAKPVQVVSIKEIGKFGTYGNRFVMTYSDCKSIGATNGGYTIAKTRVDTDVTQIKSIGVNLFDPRPIAGTPWPFGSG